MLRPPWVLLFLNCIQKSGASRSTRTHHDVGGLDLLLLALRAPHGLLDLDRAPDFPVDAYVEEDQTDIGEDLRDQGLGPEVVVEDVVFVPSQFCWG